MNSPCPITIQSINKSTLRGRKRRENLRALKIESISPQASLGPTLGLRVLNTTPPNKSTLRSRKRREKLKASIDSRIIAVIPDFCASTPTPALTLASAVTPTLDPNIDIILEYKEKKVKLAYDAWPCIRTSGQFGYLKQTILENAIKDIRKKLNSKSKTKRLDGHNFTWHWQIFQFLKLQLKEIILQKTSPVEYHPKTRNDMATQVANGGGWGQKVVRRILRHESIWIKKRTVPYPRQGKHANIASWLDDESTLMAVRRHILEVGESRVQNHIRIILIIANII